MALSVLCFCFFIFSHFSSVNAQSSVAIYLDNAPSSPWVDYSWGTAKTNNNFASTSPTPQSGSSCLNTSITVQYQGFYLSSGSSSSYATSLYDSITGFIQFPLQQAATQLTVTLMQAGTQIGAQTQLAATINATTITSNTWLPFVWSFDSLIASGLLASSSIDGFIIQLQSAAPATFALDTLYINARKQNQKQKSSQQNVTINLALNRHAINPNIYGVNFAGANLINKSPLNRWGGNSASRYNWRTDSHNAGNDWFFYNLANWASGADTSKFPVGTTADLFLQSTWQAGATAIITMPLIGAVSSNGMKNYSYSIRALGPMTGNECISSGYASWCNSDAGNGISSASGNPKLRAPYSATSSVPFTPADGVAWVTHIAQTFPNVDLNTRLIIALDNEPMLWSSTHMDLHYAGTTYDELWASTQAMASALKAQFPNIRISGPTLYGWCAYLYSGADGCSPGADYASHNNTYFLPWYMSRVNAYYLAHSVQLVDMIDLHSYPNAGFGLAETDDATTQAARLANTRYYWDDTFVENSWVGTNYGSVYLIPRVRAWMQQYAPNVKFGLGFSEWNVGADDLYDAALANIDMLGLFGWQNLSHSCRWVSPVANSLAEQSYAFYLYYDHSSSSSIVGGDSVQVSSTVAYADLSVYGIHNATTSTLYIVFVNKQVLGSAVQSVAVNIESAYTVSTGTEHAAYLFSTTTNNVTIVNDPSVVVGTGLAYTVNVPAFSALLVVIKGVALGTPSSPTSSTVSTTSPAPSTSSSPSASPTTTTTTTTTTTAAATTSITTTATPTTVAVTTTAPTTTTTTATPTTTSAPTTLVPSSSSLPSSTATSTTTPTTAATPTPTPTVTTTTTTPTTAIVVTSVTPTTTSAPSSSSATTTSTPASTSSTTTTSTPASTSSTPTTTSPSTSAHPSTSSPASTSSSSPTTGTAPSTTTQTSSTTTALPTSSSIPTTATTTTVSTTTAPASTTQSALTTTTTSTTAATTTTTPTTTASTTTVPASSTSSTVPATATSTTTTTPTTPTPSTTTTATASGTTIAPSSSSSSSSTSFTTSSLPTSASHVTVLPSSPWFLPSSSSSSSSSSPPPSLLLVEFVFALSSVDVSSTMWLMQLLTLLENMENVQNVNAMVIVSVFVVSSGQGSELHLSSSTPMTAVVIGIDPTMLTVPSPSSSSSSSSSSSLSASSIQSQLLSATTLTSIQQAHPELQLMSINNPTPSSPTSASSLPSSSSTSSSSPSFFLYIYIGVAVVVGIVVIVAVVVVCVRVRGRNNRWKSQRTHAQQQQQYGSGREEHVAELQGTELPYTTSPLQSNTHPEIVVG